MVRDELIRRALESTNWDLMACSMPSNVLLLTGYWPAAGYSFAVAMRDGRICLIVPEDEIDIAQFSWADEVRTYCPVPLERLMTPDEPLFEAFAAMKFDLGIVADRIAFEQADAFEPAAHAPSLYRSSPARILRRVFPTATLAPGDELLAELRAIKTSAEVEHIRTACNVTRGAFLQSVQQLRPGAKETEVAALFRAAHATCLDQFPEVKRSDAFTYCMSGPNSGRASGPFSRSRNREIISGDCVVVRCHAYADGYWADVARTFGIGPPANSTRQMFDAIAATRETVFESIRPGARAADLDQAARSSIESFGFGSLIRHATGHGAGFGTLDHTARPRLHPKSDDIIQPGMVLKVELGLYSGESGGVRTGDMVAVTETGADPLTNFQWNLTELIVTH
jgi:Xaa-Pro aminopeptidase